MAENASIAKIKATEGYGAKIILAGSNLHEATEACQAYVAETNAVFISPV